MLKLKLSFAFFFVSFCTLFSQNETAKVQSKSNPIEVNASKELKEATPSLEEQGFKAQIVNEKIIYRKEVNGVIIEFIPEEQ